MSCCWWGLYPLAPPLRPRSFSLLQQWPISYQFKKSGRVMGEEEWERIQLEELRKKDVRGWYKFRGGFDTERDKDKPPLT